jgi:hypothetical protein
MGASGKVDGRAMSTTDGWGMPTAATATPTTSGFCGFGTNDLVFNCGRNGSTETLAWRDTSVAPLLISRTNAGTTGTTVNLLAKLNSSGEAVVTSTSETSGAVGIVLSGAGTSGTAKIAYSGVASCVADNSTTIGNYVILSTGTAGRCRDGGATYPTSGQVLGRWLSAVSAGSTGSVLLFGLGQQGSSSGSGGASQIFWLDRFSDTIYIGPGVTLYAAPGWGEFTAASQDFTFLVLPVGGTLRDLNVNVTGSNSGDGAIGCTIWKASAGNTFFSDSSPTSTGITISVAPSGASGIYSDTTHTYAVTAGEKIQVRCTNSASTGMSILRNISWRMVL